MDAFFETLPKGKNKPKIKQISFNMFVKEPSGTLLWRQITPTVDDPVQYSQREFSIEGQRQFEPKSWNKLQLAKAESQSRVCPFEQLRENRFRRLAEVAKFRRSLSGTKISPQKNQSRKRKRDSEILGRSSRRVSAARACPKIAFELGFSSRLFRKKSGD